MREHSKAAILDGIASRRSVAGIWTTEGRCDGDERHYHLGLFQKQLNRLGIEALVMNDADQDRYFYPTGL